MRHIFFKPQSRVDLLAIWQYVAQNNLPVAYRVEADIELAILSLADMPGMGHRRADVNNPAYRFWTVHSYVIVYRFDDLSLTVVRIVHGARDFGRLFP